MATPNKLRKLEQEKGDLHKVIPPAVNKLGQKDAAEELHLSTATISTWLKDNGYVFVGEWRKIDQQQSEVVQS